MVHVGEVEMDVPNYAAPYKAPLLFIDGSLAVTKTDFDRLFQEVRVKLDDADIMTLNKEEMKELGYITSAMPLTYASITAVRIKNELFFGLCKYLKRIRKCIEERFPNSEVFVFFSDYNTVIFRLSLEGTPDILSLRKEITKLTGDNILFNLQVELKGDN